jgi:hypothetical protein
MWELAASRSDMIDVDDVGQVVRAQTTQVFGAQNQRMLASMSFWRKIG